MKGYTFTLVSLSVAVQLVAASPHGLFSDPAITTTDGQLAPLYTPPNVFAAAAARTDGTSIAASSSSDDESHIIPDSYIIVLKESHGHHLDLHLNHLRSNLEHAIEQIGHHFSIGEMTGYAGKFGQRSLEWIRRHPAVDFVERDSIVKTMDIERGAPWGLARISHRPALGFSTLGKYEYAHNGGEGVDVYVIDTGINIHHVEFEGRAKWGKTMPQNDVDEDGNGHGTHCAGTIASARYGVAKDAHVIAVKVLGSSGSGSMSDVVGGVGWAANAASAKMQTEAARNGTHKGSVANMSLGGGKSPALDMAVNNSVKKGLHFAVAAGNDGRDACNYSPAAAENAITVGASGILDQRAYFSNIGKCVDIFGPGLNILSTWNSGPRSVNTISGTSMASPHIAGLTAYYLSLYGTDFAPTEADYQVAGVPYPTSSAPSTKDSLFNKGRQLIFGNLLGSNGVKKISLSASSSSDSKKPLDPKVLKAAMLRLSTKNALSDIPSDGTPNLLAFNNFTTTARKIVADEENNKMEEEEMVHFQPIFEKGQEMVEMEPVWEKVEAMIEEIIEEDLAWMA